MLGRIRILVHRISSSAEKLGLFSNARKIPAGLRQDGFFGGLGAPRPLDSLPNFLVIGCKTESASEAADGLVIFAKLHIPIAKGLGRNFAVVGTCRSGARRGRDGAPSLRSFG
jgi:hypothetical protein